MLCRLSFFLILLTFVLNSCTQRFYGKGITGTEYSHMNTPFYHGEKADAAYLQMQMGTGLKFAPDDQNLNGHLNFYQSFSFKHVDVAFGLNGYYGSYLAQNLPFPHRGFENGWYPYHGLGIKSQFGFKTIFDNNVIWEYIGVQAHLFGEGGSYFDLRRNQMDYLDVPESPLRFINTLYTGFRWSTTKNIDSGIYLATNRNYFQSDERKFHLLFFLNGERVGGALNVGVASFGELNSNSDFGSFGSLSVNYRF